MSGEPSEYHRVGDTEAAAGIAPALHAAQHLAAGAGRVSDPPAVGHWFKYELGRESFIVARSGEDEIKAYYNVCRHRANRIVREDFGRQRLFTCPFHGWQWKTDGALEQITDRSCFKPEAATDCLVRYAAIEYGPCNIRVNSILAGSIVSDMSRELFEIPAVARVFEKEVPLRRLGYPKDFANAVLWLAGPAFVTGLNIPVSGGNQLTRFPYMHEMPGDQSDWEGKGQTLFERDRPKS